MDAGYSGNDFTWTNNRRKRKMIRERLDKVFYNDEWSATFPFVNVRYLPRTGSDHNMLLMTCSIQDTPPIKYFKFLNFWTEKNDFQKIMQDSWDEEVTGNRMWIMQQKLKRLASSLSYWSRNIIGNVFDKIKDLEDKVEAMEAAYGEDNSNTNKIILKKLFVEQITWIKKQNNILKKKARVKWELDGDSNTKYFHSTIRQRRKKSYLHRIKNEEGNWIQGNMQISEAAIQYFSNLFTQSVQESDFSILNKIDNHITEEDNIFLTNIPTTEEVKEVIFSLNPNSAAGPDGFNGCFYHSCWDIISNDVVNMIQAFFEGQRMSRFYTSTCLVLIPKVESPSFFS
ncbi:uncharacterized protein LOC142180106 [Nicotiana tabacum]|uniref:Uncharacterized protein LOC142180106 n=1 Tax=Nicotiana tabacum TaxID=4097 RepID=A0AC58UD28_TOBAC